MRHSLLSFSFVLTALFTLAACAPQNLPEQEQVVVSTIPPLPTSTPISEKTTPSESASGLTAGTNSYAVYGFSQPVTASGNVLVLTGRVLNVNGDPVEGAAVEIWQTDANGIYDHPGDSSTASRDMGFQFYGTSVVDPDGNYAFRTLRPGKYEPRPPHIHVKVRVNGAVVLTTQLYFSDTGNAGGLGAGADQLLLTLEDDPYGGDFHVGSFDFVVDTGIGSGALPLTPSQAEGPYYPVVNVAEYDQDLASVGE
ncbi:MAG: hypothetical protein P8046_04120 [Anaerolineales bacterium]